jgi:flagellar FliL protein
MLIIIVVGAVVLVGGVGVFALKSMGGHKKGAVAKGPTSSLELGEFVVNLADANETRYLKASIVLGIDGPVAAKGEGGSSGGDPRVRDAIIEVLSSKRFAELSTPAGKDALKKQILAAVNQRMEGSKAVAVYFNEFAMQ